MEFNHANRYQFRIIVDLLRIDNFISSDRLMPISQYEQSMEVRPLPSL